MAYSQQQNELRVEIDTKGCELETRVLDQMDADLRTLRHVVDDFPMASLYVTVIHHPRSKDYHVKTSLALPGKTLFTGDRDVEVHPAFERCLRKLVRKVDSYKLRMRGDSKWLRQASDIAAKLRPSQDLDLVAVTKAAQADDYGAFRRGMDSFEESLTSRIWNWIQRYPEIELQLGDTVMIADIVEDVFLNAFEKFAIRPQGIPLGDWLESLIDPSVQALIQSPDEEFANISFARAILERGII
ncbi:MAG: hypothetical protein KDA60_14735 [Planctomycetales bacterium]|nr:hypothetical protein [Planctomycetales bacterium]